MKSIHGLMLIPALFAAAAAFAAPSDAPSVAAGQQSFTMCRACHTLDKGGRNGVGPNLSGLFGRTSGSAPGFTYSPAMKSAGLKWDAKTLDAFLAAPSKTVPGTKMPINVADPVKRAALIAYLKQATAN